MPTKQYTTKPNRIVDIKLSHILIVIVLIAVLIIALSTRGVSANSNEPKYEINENKLDVQNLISQNANISTYKEQLTGLANVNYNTLYSENPTLPRGESIVKQEGVLGQDRLTIVRTYEDQVMTKQVILSRETVNPPVPKLIDVGTSDFLANNKVHIGDIMYLTSELSLKESYDDSSEDVVELKNSLDVKLLELINEDWCKVSFDDSEGYMHTSDLTSSAVTPEVVEKNRIQRILLGVNIDMELNKSSNLTEDDYSNIFSDLPQDTSDIIKDNYIHFKEAEEDYDINGIFLAAIAIHESNWGNSQIANDKKNLFGFGAYDESPYESSFNFDDYAEGIDNVAKFLVNNYLNPPGTEIYDDEIAEGKYYNGPTVKGVNTRYASDPEWYNKVFNHMEALYEKLN